MLRYALNTSASSLFWFDSQTIEKLQECKLAFPKTSRFVFWISILLMTLKWSQVKFFLLPFDNGNLYRISGPLNINLIW